MAQIKDGKQYRAVMARIDELFFETDENTPSGDPRLQELDVLSALVEEYEQKHYPIETPSGHSACIRDVNPKPLASQVCDTGHSDIV